MMAEPLYIGMTFEKTITVTEELAARHLVGKGVAVLSTPELVRFVEVCCVEGIRPYLQNGQVSVGMRIDIRHLAATPVGMRANAVCKLLEVDRRRLRFSFEVHDELDKIAEGEHERFIIDRDKKRQRLEDKMARWKPRAEV